MERVKEGGRGGEGKKETPADKPLNFENRQNQSRSRILL